MRNATYIGRSQCKCKCHPARSVPALVLARDSPQWSSAKREPSRCALLLDGARPGCCQSGPVCLRSRGASSGRPEIYDGEFGVNTKELPNKYFPRFWEACLR